MPGMPVDVVGLTAPELLVIPSFDFLEPDVALLYHLSRGKPYVELSQATIFRKLLRLGRFVLISHADRAFTADGFYGG